MDTLEAILQVTTKVQVLFLPPKSGARDGEILPATAAQRLQVFDGSSAVRGVVSRVGAVGVLREMPTTPPSKLNQLFISFVNDDDARSLGRELCNYFAQTSNCVAIGRELATDVLLVNMRPVVAVHRRTSRANIVTLLINVWHQPGMYFQQHDPELVLSPRQKVRPFRSQSELLLQKLEPLANGPIFCFESG
jgi:hypothetical protein